MAPAAAIPVWVYYAATAVAVAGSVYAGYSAKQTSDFNAKVAKQEAEYQRQKGAAEEEQHLERLKKQMAVGKVAAAKSGVSLLSGSAQDVFDENLEEGLYDAIMIRYGSQARARSSEAQASSFSAQGNAAMTSSLFKAGSTMLTGATRAGAFNSGGGTVSDTYQFTTGPE